MSALEPVTSDAGAVRVGILGCGTVGAAVARILTTGSSLYAARVGRPLTVSGIAVRTMGTPRDLGPVARDVLTTDAAAVVDGADIVVEVMGGIEPAQALITRALGAGTPVVTANKQLIAASGPALQACAAEHGASLDYEAAVAAAVPILRVVRESLAGDQIDSIRGIVNGSTNFVLDMVAREGVGFAEALQRAGELGYLEADPTEDIEGIDAAAKLVILARLAWGVDVRMQDVQREGIAGLGDADFAAAAGRGEVIKLVASASAHGDPRHPRVALVVRPVGLDADDPLARVYEGRNGVVIEAASAGMISVFGAGAGGPQTASAVISDIVNAARNLTQ